MPFRCHRIAGCRAGSNGCRKERPVKLFRQWTRTAAPAVLAGATLTALHGLTGGLSGIPMLGVAGLWGLSIAGERYRPDSLR